MYWLIIHPIHLLIIYLSLLKYKFHEKFIYFSLFIKVTSIYSLNNKYLGSGYVNEWMNEWDVLSGQIRFSKA